MSPHPLTVGPEATVEQCASLLLSENVDLLPVVDSQENLIGLVSESNLFVALVDQHRRQDPVSLFMNRQFVAIESTAPLATVVDQFVLHQVRYLPVLQNGKLVGVVQRREILKMFDQRSPNRLFSTT